jgi:hypothetical protein
MPQSRSQTFRLLGTGDPHLGSSVRSSDPLCGKIAAGMTQVISILRRGILFHLSDRLLTAPDAAALPRDLRSNKSVVAITSDSLGVVGYSGRSSIHGHPTDLWLAGAILSNPDTPWTEPSEPVGLGDLSPGQITQRLKTHLEAYVAWLAPRPRADLHLLIQYVGYRRDRRLNTALPFVFELAKMPGDDQVYLSSRRDTGERLVSEHVVCTPPLDPDAMRILQADLAAARGSVHECFKVALKAMRSASERATVGESILATWLSPVLAPNVSMVAVKPTSGDFDFVRSGRFDVPVTHTPWILSEAGIYRPSLASNLSMQLSSGQEIRVGGLPTADGWCGIVFEPQVRDPSILPLGSAVPSDLGATMTAAMAVDDAVSTILMEFGVRLVRGVVDPECNSYLAVAEQMPLAGSSARQRLLLNLEDAGFRIFIRDSSTAELVSTGEWSDVDLEEGANRLTQMDDGG